MSEIPITFATSDQTYQFTDLHRLFAETSYGKTLAPRVRYGRYRPTSISEEEWRNALGADVNNLEHMRLTYGLARQFIRYQNMYGEDVLSRPDQEDLLLAAVSHDWGEAVVGDVMFDLKTVEVENDESSAIRGIIHEMFGNGGDELPERVERVICEVVENRDTRLGQMFRVIEQIGYLRTGLNAFDLSQQIDNPDFRDGLQWAASNVLQNQIPSLLQAAERYPAVFFFLSENADLITEAFIKIRQSVFDNYDVGEDQKNLQKWCAAQYIWQQDGFA
ncbi:hypothetical protein IPM65_02185 [Candidatus Roizmanbacteria bacterium]|nr:MAG: hypothetical protein IPM65_02185 [Candidatus Roizmanbacteria bacterium]